MRRMWAWMASLILVGVLAACGQPGALTLPDPEPPALAAAPMGSVEQVFPLEPIAFDPPGDMVNETPTAWFVEFASAPSVDGGRAATMANERAAFRRDAAAVGAAFEQRRDFQTLFNGISVNAGPADIAKIAQLPGVVAVWPVEKVAIPETQASLEPELYTALAMTGADVVQSELGFTGSGIKVAVMDTGIDYNHPDLGGGWGNRVADGWDFVGDAFTGENDPVPGPYPLDCHGHGTHVAGIIGANGVVTGVAPDVTFGAYRVFGCAGYTWADIMIEAMEMALADGMDVLNMSIGSAFQWPQYPTAVASDRLVKRGMVVVASIGNSGANGLYSAGAPGLGKDVIGVASFDNTDVYVPYFDVNDNEIGYITMSFSPPAPTSGTEEIVYVGQACNADLPLLADPAGKVALAVRGACAFSEKAVNAIAAGAVGVVIHNNAPGLFSGTLGAPLGNDIPVVGISMADGLFIRAQEEPVDMTWTDEMTSAPNPTGGLISSFSSYGLSPDLSLKPDIGAPGGSIYSTYPGGGYATLSGTSMSSPHVAGAVALLLEAMPRTRAEDVRGMLQNAAVPADWWGYPGIGYIDNVHRQGAGMLQIDDAILATTRIEPAKIALGESAGGPVRQRIKIDNLGSTAVSYELSFVNALSTGPNTSPPSFFLGNAFVTFSPAAVTVQAGASRNVTATISPATGPIGGIYGGYIVATPDDGGPEVRVPFAGYVGDYQAITALAPGLYGMPALGWTPDGVNFGFAGAGDVFTLEGYDLPYVLVHLAHHPQYMELNIIDAITGQPVHPVFHKFFEADYLPRNATTAGFFAFAWGGDRIHSQAARGRGAATPQAIPVPNGEYQIEIRLLKALGDKNDASHWETWTSPSFFIARP